jgi:hypothetical protein
MGGARSNRQRASFMTEEHREEPEGQSLRAKTFSIGFLAVVTIATLGWMAFLAWAASEIFRN